MIAFGPVPSRRLGRSLGINNIPPKVCTYSCIYCQLGRTIKMQVTRPGFYEPGEVLKAVQSKVEAARETGEAIDYLTFVPDGEPTLDANLEIGRGQLELAGRLPLHRLETDVRKDRHRVALLDDRLDAGESPMELGFADGELHPRVSVSLP